MPKISKISKNNAAIRQQSNDCLRVADRKQAARLLKRSDAPASTIWGLVGCPIYKNIGVLMAYLEALPYEQFAALYSEIMGDNLHVTEDHLDVDSRWEIARELLPAMFATEIEIAFDKF